MSDSSDRVKHDSSKKKNKPTKPGHTWVEDKSVKGGGYWRKLPKGSGVSTAASVAGAAAIAGLAGAAMYAASRKKEQPSTPSPNIPIVPESIKNKISNKTAIAAGAGLASAGVAGAIALSKKNKPLNSNPEVTGGISNRSSHHEENKNQEEEAYQAYQQKKKEQQEADEADRKQKKKEQRDRQEKEAEEKYKAYREKSIKDAEETFERNQNARTEALNKDRELVKGMLPNIAEANTSAGFEVYDSKRQKWYYDSDDRLQQQKDEAFGKFLSDSKNLPNQDSFRNFLRNNDLKEDGFEKAKNKWLEHIGLDRKSIESSVREEVEKRSQHFEQSNEAWALMSEDKKKESKEKLIKESVDNASEKVDYFIKGMSEFTSLKHAYDKHVTKSEERENRLRNAHEFANFFEVGDRNFRKTMNSIFDDVEEDFNKVFEELKDRFSKGAKATAGGSSSGKIHNGKSWHEVLDVPENASKEDVRKAYKKLIRQYHPDLNPNNPDAEQKAKDLTAAYSVWEELFDKRKDSFMSDAYKAGMTEIGLDIVPGLMPLAYVEGRMDAKPGKRPKKLQCRPGFEQRGAACQKIKPKKVEAAKTPSKGGAGGAIGTALALTAAAAAGGAAVYLATNRRQGGETPQPPVALPPAIQKSLGNKALLAAGASGVALGTAATLTIAHRQKEQAVAQERAVAEKEVAAVKRKAEEDLQTATKKIHDGYQNEISVVNDRLNGVRTKLKEKETELTSVRSEAAKTKGDLDAHKAVLEATRSELEKASEQAKNNQSELEKTQSELEQTKGTAKEYQSELDKTKNELSEKNKTVEESDRTITKQRENLGEATKQVEELTKKSTELESQVKTLESEVTATRSERDKANSELNDLQSTLENRVKQEVGAERRKLEDAQKRAIAEIDDAHAVRAKQAVIAVAREAEAQIEAAKDPSPGSGFRPDRGSLIANEEGIKLGASTRKGSDFISRPTGDQLNKISEKAHKTVEDIYAEKSKIQSRSFADTVLDIDKNLPNQVDNVSNKSLSPESKQGVLNIAQAAEVASRSEPETDKLYKNEYSKRRGETEGQKKERVESELVKLGKLEKEVVKQRLREKSLALKKQEVKEVVAEEYRAALRELHQSAMDEYGNYTPSKVSSQALKKFDDTAKKIHARAEKMMTDALNETFSPSFGQDVLNRANKISDATPDEDANELLRKQLKGDSVNYLAGKLEVSLALKKNTKTRNDAQESNLYISALLTKVIQSVYPKVKSVTSARKTGSNLVGYFRDVEGATFTFELSDNSKRIKIKPAVKKDSLKFDNDDKLNCKPGYEQMGAVCKPIVVNKVLPPVVQSAARLVDKTIETGELPSRTEIAKELGVQARELLKNPVKAIKEGFEREKKFKEAYKNATGKEAPTKAQAAATVAKKTAEYVKENPESIKEAALFVAGSAGGAIGTAVAGPAGGMAGDLAAPIVVRAAFTADEAARRAHAKLAKDEAFQKASKLEKLKKLGAATLDELKDPKMKDKIEDGATDDVSGWVVGNAVGKTMEAAGVPGSITTAVATGAAMGASPKIAKAKDRIKAGENAGKVAKETAKAMVKELIENKIKEGNEREAKMREKANKYIKRLTEPMRQARQAQQ